MTRCRPHQMLIVVAVCCVLLSLSQSVCAQVSTLQEVVSQKVQWKKFAEDGRRFQFEGRFQGRANDTFHLNKFDIPCRLPASIRLPDRMKINQCLDVTGKFLLTDGRLTFLVSRLVVRDTDLEKLSKQAAELSPKKTAELLAIAAQFEPIAEYYADKDLKQEIAAARTLALSEKRKNAAGIVDELQALLTLAESLNVDQRLLQTIRFEILITKWKSPKADAASLMTAVKTLESWDRVIPEPPDHLRTQFEKKAVALYEQGSDADRLWLHRLFYIALRRTEIREMLKDDGSNGMSLADLVRKEFPSESDFAAELEKSEIQFQFEHVASLSRPQLQQLIALLERLNQRDQVAGIVDQWLKAQERQFGTETLIGLLRTADEYLFVADLRKQSELHSKAVDLLKQAWSLAATSSPDDAQQIADRLKRLGWEHLNGQWMTSQQIALLPKDDIQLAIREGRVVRGMTSLQVSQTLGQPARISRIGSSRSMRELWIYDSDGSGGMVVRFRQAILRKADSKADSKVVEEISRISEP